ncbi:MAG TPA: hypothetical protein PLN33_19450 [Hyphomonadaceae bacterium]|mgnify:CR=1 FL=1|jgi:hypothetical protein|nr:hypothetical protein [Hyphomonadaceae bacterium]HPN06485.1 hypothetical protein [Hyphomonadaceae bacterium]
MRGLIALGIALSSAMALAAPAFAQQPNMAAKPEAVCTAEAKPPAGFEDWNGKAAITTATSAEHVAHASLALGKGYDATLLNTPKVAMPVQPEKPGGSVAHAGLFSFTVETAGSYTVALGTAAWIDVLEDGKSLEPTKFGHGPECTGIRKMVVFPMKPGVHTLQVSANAAPTLKLMVAKAP